MDFLINVQSFRPRTWRSNLLLVRFPPCLNPPRLTDKVGPILLRPRKLKVYTGDSINVFYSRIQFSFVAIYEGVRYISSPSLRTTLKYFCINHGDQRYFFQFEIIINVLLPPYLNTYVIFYGHILILSVRGPSLYVRIWRLQTSDSDV